MVKLAGADLIFQHTNRMPRTVFQVPDDLTKPLSEKSKTIYRGRLNKLAVAGYKTRADLLQHQEEVVKCIETATEHKHERRVYLSAVFWILHETPNEERVTYYRAFQRNKD